MHMVCWRPTPYGFLRGHGRMLGLEVHELQAWAVLEAADGNTQLARQLFKCAVKADPSSEPSWLVRMPALGQPGKALIYALLQRLEGAVGAN